MSAVTGDYAARVDDGGGVIIFLSYKNVTSCF